MVAELEEKTRPMGAGVALEIGRLMERVRLRVSSDVDAAALIEKTLKDSTGATDLLKLTDVEADRFEAALSELSQSIPPKGFSREDADPFVKIAMGFPLIWPSTAQQPMVLKLEYLLSEDADREQTAYVGLGDSEQVEASYRYDCKMLSLLVARVPEGFVGFPAVEADEKGRAVDAEVLRAAIFDYFYVADEERSKAMRFVARRFMAKYWAKIAPQDYL